MHKHQDGYKYTPKDQKLKSTSGLHSHGDDYTLAPNDEGHTHLNKETKARTGQPVDVHTKLEGKKNAQPHTGRDSQKQEVKKEKEESRSVQRRKKVGKKASKK